VDSLIKKFSSNSHISGGNADFVEDLYERYLSDPESVDPAWKRYFDGLGGNADGEVAHSEVRRSIQIAALAASRGLGGGQDQQPGGVAKLITAYRSRGHLQAELDPLALTAKPTAPDLDIDFHGLSKSDLDREFETGAFHFGGPERLKLKDLLVHLKATYCGSIGSEFMHITDADQRRWLYSRLEKAAGNPGFDAARRTRILERLTAAEGLERYLHTRYVGQKRFSLEGGDSLIPLMDTLVQRAGASGMKDVVIGMAHRGRLNVLVNTLGKPPQKIFAEFEGKFDHPHDPSHSGDVKYHMGFSADVATPGGSLHLALAFNPSHLEIVDPVVVGSVRARQTRRGDTERKLEMPVLVHGDAAFAGQGVVMELFQMSQARGFAIGGTVHVVINNQVGFTTHRADDARSTLYCTDVAKMVGAPVLHVNGDDPDAVAFCADLAFDFRQTFGKDVVIDLVCYRKHGHNEADEPAATQPLMYQAIRKHKSAREIYADRLIAEGVLSAEQVKTITDDYRAKLEAGEVTVELAAPAVDAFSVDWTPYLGAKLDDPVETTVDPAHLHALALKINTLPDGIQLHPRVAKVYADRLKMTEGELEMDWGFAENLAYATLLDEGFKLRLVGQDSGRGTFFHRHAVLHQQDDGETWWPLRQLVDTPEDVTIIDSLLSEEAVMGFEYGYSTTDPGTLTIWEAQFGDFANGAQVVIDQFISSGEAKWGRLSGLVLFLPHGYEGQGPEHSSARLERYLQLCALDNMQVCVPTTPAQMFHMLRRQMKRAARKPLIVMTPKSMLRNKQSVSSLKDLSDGRFQRLIPDSQVGNAKKASRVILCSGKVYYDLLEAHHTQELTDVALVRIEQLYPFPREELRAELKRFSAAKQVVWCQEEPQNQGAWYQIQHHLRACLHGKQVLDYAGRSRSPSPAAGHFNTHVEEQNALVEKALGGQFDSAHVAE
jgi:2-oxoglutarate dehydrogenase E1 component